MLTTLQRIHRGGGPTWNRLLAARFSHQPLPRFRLILGTLFGAA